MDKIKEILLLIPLFLILYVLFCLIIAFLVSFYRYVVKKESFWENFREWFIDLFLELLSIIFYNLLIPTNVGQGLISSSDKLKSTTFLSNQSILRHV